ncbi:MAG: hypothetical protein CL878_05910 [Dehalococcoidia bacterium]|nr:hypothetical protein [Dehalococcoidia bacterium]
MAKRKIILLGAAALFLLAILFPLWTVMLSAPTYPEGNLAVWVFSYKVEGDMDEWNRVGRLVGVKVPPPIPDAAFVIVPVAFAALAAVCVLTAFRERWLTVAVVAPWPLLALLGAWAQYSLYVFGHDLDPDRPLKYIQPFTPPVVGIVTLHSIKTYHFPYAGSLLYGLAAGLVILAWWLRRRETVDDGTTAIGA